MISFLSLFIQPISSLPSSRLSSRPSCRPSCPCPSYLSSPSFRPCPCRHPPRAQDPEGIQFKIQYLNVALLRKCSFLSQCDGTSYLILLKVCLQSRESYLYLHFPFTETIVLVARRVESYSHCNALSTFIVSPSICSGEQNE